LGSKNLFEFEVYVSKDGWANDDEGNRWYVGPRYAEGTYGGREASAIASAGQPRSSARHRPVNLRAVQQRAAILRALEYQPRNKFLLSISQQLADGRALSAKQRDVARKILLDLGGSESAKLFEEEEQGMVC
jgi:hypothetical protein